MNRVVIQRTVMPCSYYFSPLWLDLGVLNSLLFSEGLVLHMSTVTGKTARTGVKIDTRLDIHSAMCRWREIHDGVVPIGIYLDPILCRSLISWLG